jgi:hypothetical protein
MILFNIDFTVQGSVNSEMVKDLVDDKGLHAGYRDLNGNSYTPDELEEFLLDAGSMELRIYSDQVAEDSDQELFGMVRGDADYLIFAYLTGQDLTGIFGINGEDAFEVTGCESLQGTFSEECVRRLEDWSGINTSVTGPMGREQ